MTVTELIVALQDRDATVRWQAAQALGFALNSDGTSPEAKKAVSALVEALKDEDKRVREFAATALGLAFMSGGKGPAGRSGCPESAPP